MPLTISCLTLQAVISPSAPPSSTGEQVTAWEGMVRVSLLRMLADEVRPQHDCYPRSFPPSFHWHWQHCPSKYGDRVYGTDALPACVRCPLVQQRSAHTSQIGYRVLDGDGVYTGSGSATQKPLPPPHLP